VWNSGWITRFGGTGSAVLLVGVINVSAVVPVNIVPLGHVVAARIFHAYIYTYILVPVSILGRENPNVILITRRRGWIAGTDTVCCAAVTVQSRFADCRREVFLEQVIPAELIVSPERSRIVVCVSGD